MEETLFGQFSYNEYSFFFIQLFPCINSTENNNHCKPQEVIDYYLRGTFLCMEFEDIELVPHNYSYPIRSRNQDIYFTVGKKLFQEVHIFYQLVKIETDKEIFGFEIKAFQEDITGIEDKNRLIEFLLKKGYVNEYYYDYISYFYPATLTPQDKEFITDLRVGRKKDYNYQLIKIDSIIEELSNELYTKVGVLNISLVKHIADHVSDSQEMSSRLDKIVRCIKKYKEKDFVYAFYQEYDSCSVLFDRLFKIWISI